MRTDIRWYFWLTFTSLLGLIGLQGYNAWQQFRQETRTFEEEVQWTLENTVAEQVRQQRTDLRQTFELFILTDDRIELGVQPHWNGQNFVYSLSETIDGAPRYVQGNAVPDSLDAANLPQERIAAAFGELLMYHFEQGKQYQWTPTLDEELFFWYYLQRLDSASLHTRLLTTFQQEHLGDTLMVYLTDSALANQAAGQSWVDQLDDSHHITNAVEARITGATEQVRVVLPNPFLTLFWRSLWLLAGSLLIILLATFTFIRLFRGLVNEKKLGELKDDFINNVTHELQTPLATLTVALEAAEKHQNKHGLPDPPRDYLGIARKEAAHLSGMIDHLLQIRTLGHKATLDTEPTDILDLAHQAAEATQLRAKKPLTVVWEVPQMALWVMAEPMLLEQIWFNLMDNALKYGPDEGVVLTIGAAIQGHQARMWIRDNGPGIPPEHLPYIFDRFFRVPKGLTRPQRGLGLGLFFVKTTLEKMGGGISVYSRPGKGTTFTLTLPLTHHENTLG